MSWNPLSGEEEFVSQGTLDTIDQSRRARLNDRAEMFTEVRCKILHVLRVDKGPMCEDSVKG